MFNSLKYVKNLEEAGVPRQQAEAHVLLVSEILEMNLASKHDITELKNDFALLRTEVTSVRFELEQKIIQSEQRMTIRLGTIVSIALGLAVTLTKLFS